MRGAIKEYLKNDDFFLVKVSEIEDIDDLNDVKKQALMRSIKES
jgi:ATP-dependent Lon protease